MGDRANFGFKQGKNVLFLYGHWAGEGMLGQLANALDKARPRWNDPAYATRIVTSQMIGDDWNSETGWGLTINTVQDNEHKIPVVDFEARTVTLFEDRPPPERLGRAIFTMPLDNFVTKYRK